MNQIIRSDSANIQDNWPDQIGLDILFHTKEKNELMVLTYSFIWF